MFIVVGASRSTRIGGVPCGLMNNLITCSRTSGIAEEHGAPGGARFGCGLIAINMCLLAEGEISKLTLRVRRNAGPRETPIAISLVQCVKRSQVSPLIKPATALQSASAIVMNESVATPVPVGTTSIGMQVLGFSSSIGS